MRSAGPFSYKDALVGFFAHSRVPSFILSQGQPLVSSYRTASPKNTFDLCFCDVDRAHCISLADVRLPRTLNLVDAHLSTC